MPAFSGGVDTGGGEGLSAAAGGAEMGSGAGGAETGIASDGAGVVASGGGLESSSLGSLLSRSTS